MFINEIHKLVQEAHNMRVSKTEREYTEQAAWDKQERVQAQYLWEKLKSDIRKTVLAHKFQVHVAKLDIYTQDMCERLTSRPPKYLEAKDLIGRYKYLYEKCEAEGLTPVVWWNHDTGGIRCWYEFDVKW